VSKPDPTPFSRTDDTATLLRPAPPPLGAIVRVENARASPTQICLAEGSCVVGAGSDADLIIEDKMVSRRHVELELRPEGIAVRDLGSRNGTFYLGQRIEAVVLSLGSCIRVGDAELRFEADTSTLQSAGDGGVSYRHLLGVSEAMRKLFAILARLEGSLVSILVEGESGVGKELFARAIHEGSNVSSGPLVVLNCGAISRELVLSELFGHKKGSFTGASDARIGAFEAAHGGTLFLDEIGELPLEAQPALLRVLESGEFKPLGETAPRHVTVRVIAATNRDLQSEIEAGNFREDLFYRIAVVKLRVPPLRERQHDVRLLAGHFAKQAGAGELPEEVMTHLQQRSWPGNARELRNAVLAYLAIGMLPDQDAAPGGLLELALRQSIDTAQPYQEQRELFNALFSRVYFEALLEKTGGNQSEAARLCGIERSYLGKLLKKYGIGQG